MSAQPAEPVGSPFDEGLTALDAELERKLAELLQLLSDDAEAAIDTLNDAEADRA